MQLSWSPEQIAGRLKLENNGKTVICHETIYSYLYSEYGIRNRFYRYLRKKRQFRYPKISRRHRTLIPNRVPIIERPKEIAQRVSLGHWEGDLMVFGRKTKTNLITGKHRISSLTLDNGSEFARHEEISEKLGIKTYFCEPYKSYQKGTIENGNKQLREWFSKQAPIDEISMRTIHSKLKLLNERPMKCLGYNTPSEIFFRRKILFDSKCITAST